MDKRSLSVFAEELRKEIKKGNLNNAVEMIGRKNLSDEELEFVLMCLRMNGYDAKAGRFLLLESDNSAFLKLVSDVEKAIKEKNNGSK